MNCPCCLFPQPGAPTEPCVTTPSCAANLRMLVCTRRLRRPRLYTRRAIRLGAVQKTLVSDNIRRLSFRTNVRNPVSRTASEQKGADVAAQGGAAAHNRSWSAAFSDPARSRKTRFLPPPAAPLEMTTYQPPCAHQPWAHQPRPSFPIKERWPFRTTSHC
jgi:hypothetical protein